MSIILKIRFYNLFYRRRMTMMMLAETAGNRDVLHPNFVHDFLGLLPRFSITQSSKFKEMKTNRAQIQYQGVKSEAQK